MSEMASTACPPASSATRRRAAALIASTSVLGGLLAAAGSVGTATPASASTCSGTYSGKTTALSWGFPHNLYTQGETRLTTRAYTDGVNGCHDEINGVQVLNRQCYWNWTINETLCDSLTGYSPPSNYKGTGSVHADADGSFSSQLIGQNTALHDWYHLKVSIRMYRTGYAYKHCWQTGVDFTYAHLVDEVHYDC